MSSDLIDVDHGDVKPMLVESKLYVMNQEHQYMEFLDGDMVNKIQVEAIFEEAFARTPEEGDNTRIFVTFTNSNSNGTTFKVTDTERLSRRFKLDEFVNGYYATVNDGISEASSLQILPQTLAACLNFCAMSALSLTTEKQTDAEISLATNVLGALVAVLLNDPLDAVLILHEQELKEGQSEADVSLVGFWTVKSRD